MQQPLIKQESELERQIKQIELNNITPMDALQILAKLKSKL
ncbi:MAG: hypothetical protein V1655_04245 [bacterium]